MYDNEVEGAILKHISSGGENRMGHGGCYIVTEIQDILSGVHKARVFEAIWSLLAKRLIFIDYTQGSHHNWKLCLTELGRQAATDEDANPDLRNEYLKRLNEKSPNISSVVLLYINEAIRAYEGGAYLSAMVMLGVASEAAMLELGESLFYFLSGTEKDKFEKIYFNSKKPFVAKFLEIRKRIEPRKNDLPDGLGDNMSLFFDSVTDLLRINRNDAGHPTGKKFSRGDVKISLQVFASQVVKIYKLIRYFNNQSGIAS